jgi:hypothetical protein
MTALGQAVSVEEAGTIVAGADHDKDGSVSFSEFAMVCWRVTNQPNTIQVPAPLPRFPSLQMYASKADIGLKTAVSKKHGALARVAGAVGHHTYADEEKVRQPLFGARVLHSVRVSSSCNDPTFLKEEVLVQFSVLLLRVLLCVGNALGQLLPTSISVLTRRSPSLST